MPLTEHPETQMPAQTTTPTWSEAQVPEATHHPTPPQAQSPAQTRKKSNGNKRKKGDMRTPEGVFQVSDIQDASGWTHDFGDGKGEISGAYGNHFIRLSVPGQKGIGIHGTHLPESIGTRASEGCIRMNNKDLEQLVKLIYPPLVVVITPGREDILLQ